MFYRFIDIVNFVIFRSPYFLFCPSPTNACLKRMRKHLAVVDLVVVPAGGAFVYAPLVVYNVNYHTKLRVVVMVEVQSDFVGLQGLLHIGLLEMSIVGRFRLSYDIRDVPLNPV